LFAPTQNAKQCAAIVKVNSAQAMNPSPQELPYRVRILNNFAEVALRESFA
jgi:hypothetical protein